MNNNDFLESFTQVLQPVYEQIRDFGDAPSFQKGIVRGMMLAAISFGVSTEELTAIINEKRQSVFGDAKRPNTVTKRQKEMSHWLDSMGNLNPEELEEYLDTPTFMRDSGGK